MREPETANTTADIMATEHTAKGRRQRKQVAAMQRRKRALELRASGATYQQIADALGYHNRTSAFDAVASALKDITREPAGKLRDLELERLDAMHAALWPSAMQGDAVAIAGCLKIGERRAKLLGMDAPTKVEGKVEQTVKGDFASLPPDDQKRRLERRFVLFARHGYISLTVIEEMHAQAKQHIDFLRKLAEARALVVTQPGDKTSGGVACAEILAPVEKSG